MVPLALNDYAWRLGHKRYPLSKLLHSLESWNPDKAWIPVKDPDFRGDQVPANKYGAGRHDGI